MYNDYKKYYNNWDIRCMQIIPRTINNVIVKEGYLKYYLPDHFKNDK